MSESLSNCVNIPSQGTFCSVPPPATAPPAIQLIPNRQNKLEHPTNFVLALDRDTCCSAGYIQITFDPDLLMEGGEDTWEGGPPNTILDAVDFAMNPCLYPIPSQTSGIIYIGVRPCAYQSGACAGGNGDQNIFLHFTPLTQEGVSLTAEWICCPGHGEIDLIPPTPPCTSLTSITLTELPVLGNDDPYDPNYKEVGMDYNQLMSHAYFSKNEAQWVHYRIHFQNEGIGPAWTVKINDSLHEKLDPSTFQMEYARLGYEEITFANGAQSNVNTSNSFGFGTLPDTSTVSCDSGPYYSSTIMSMPHKFTFALCYMRVQESITWYFYQNNALPGTGSPNYLQSHSFLETTGELRFKVKTHCFEGEYGAIIPNHAMIVFMDDDAIMSPVSTDTCLLEKICCDYRLSYTPGVGPVNKPIGPFSNTTNADSIIFLSNESDSGYVSDPRFDSTNTEWRFDYAFGAYDSNGVFIQRTTPFEGVDKVRFLLCDSTMVNCDTVEIILCINIPAGELTCDEKPCPPKRRKWTYITGIALLIAFLLMLIRRLFFRKKSEFDEREP